MLNPNPTTCSGFSPARSVYTDTLTCHRTTKCCASTEKDVISREDSVICCLFFVVPTPLYGYVFVVQLSLMATEMICVPLELEEVVTAEGGCLSHPGESKCQQLSSKNQSHGGSRMSRKKSVFISPCLESYRGIIKGIISQPPNIKHIL